MRLWLALPALAALIALAPSCLDPTQITLEISTEAACGAVQADGVTIRVGAPDTVATPQAQVIDATGCSPAAGPAGSNRVGSLVVVPSGAGDTLSLTVILGVDRSTDQCVVDAPDGCIVARRSLRYIAHRSLKLPIELRTDCLGVSCPADQTCVHGACVGASVDDTACSGDVCGESSLDGGACSADLATDPKNCGACGFDCSGGECKGGVCSLYPPGTQPEPLAPGACIAVAGDKVYFTTGANKQMEGDVLTVPRAGGPPEPVATGVPGGTFGIASDAKDVYYAHGDGVAALSTGVSVFTGGAYGPVATDGTHVCAGVTTTPGRIDCVGVGTVLGNVVGTPVKLAVGGGYVYSTWTSGTVWRASAASASTPVSTLTTTQPSPDGIAIVAPGQQTFFSARGAGQIDLIVEGQTPVVKPAGIAIPGPRGLAYDGASDTLYIADEGATGGSGTSPAGAIWRAKAGVASKLASGQDHPDCIAIDAGAVYWLSGNVPMKVAR